MIRRKAKEKFADGIDMAAASIQKTTRAEKPANLEAFGASPDVQVDEILKQMTLEEKAVMLGGVDSMGIRGNERLGLPTVWCSDASSGVRCFGPGTSFPALVGLTATWDRNLIRSVGEAIADECRAIGVSVLLGPGVNIARVPTCGRNFEYMGEDPFLTSQMVVPYIKGVQDHGVAATVKHYACNNSDFDRHRMNAVVDERTLREIYLPAFRAAVQQAGVKCVMNSYNPVNGEYASENRVLLTEILKEGWGFSGFVMSDWNSVYSTTGPIHGGLDLEMPRGVYMNPDSVVSLVRSGDVSAEEIDDKIRRMLTVFVEMGIYQRENIDSSAAVGGHSIELGSRAAQQSPVLLKNDQNLLPLNPALLKKVVVLGVNAKLTPTGGGGSSYVYVPDRSNLLDALQSSMPAEVSVQHFDDLSGADAKSSVADADVVIAAVGYGNVLESEGYDRSWELPDGQDSLIRAAARINPNTVVVLFAGGGVETQSWVADAKALLHAFYLGAFGGQAVTDLIVGTATPSGKLPFTMAKRWSDHPATENYVKNPVHTSPKLVNGPKSRRNTSKLPAEKLLKMKREDWPVPYREGIFVGYRHFDTADITPAFPFGFGLSYTTFTVDNVALSSRDLRIGESVELTFTVRNTGTRTGAEVIQVYIRDAESSLPRPQKELKGFAKFELSAGEETRGSIVVSGDAFSFYDPTKHAWITEPGMFSVMAGTSSRDIFWKGDVTLSL